ncbi:uncharacterized protein LOC133791222 isoform X2 [Humulus lupulus]|uniref:uncharacterized protein LOC133791222 isoform X2 n=1 Tax=Humulus lupulus TaxID=3486 RepID=UPI002B41446F|nr:uncharacterized protein LOC133791222 isoform X2 [Humulus lupulus]
MAIDAEDVLVCIWRFLRFFMHTSCVCVQKHPLFSCILLVIILVYIFFDLLLYHSPFLICIAILIRCFWSSERPPTTTIEATVKEREKMTSPTSTVKEEDYVVVNRDSVSEGFSPIRRQKSKRTIVGRNREWKVQARRKGSDMFPLTTDKSAKIFVKEREGFACGESSSTYSGNNLHFFRSETSKPKTLLPHDVSDQKLVKSDSYSVVSEADNVEDSEDDVDEEEEEEAIKNGGNKAMEWTEDDQKNLMDLGLSEIERNRRLESLIAKRRARTLFKIQAEKGLMDLDGVVPSCTIAPVFVSRNNPFEVPIGANGNESLQVPGSAPSILLPTQNPFDLPYDPLEEKPNLMADSFQQEFTAVNQKEMLYCRHESFSLGPFQFEPDHHHHPHQDRRDHKFGNYFNIEKRAFEGYGLPRYRRKSGNQDTLMEQFLSEVGVGKPRNELLLESQPRVSNSGTSKMDMELTEESNNESTSSSSSEMTNEAEVSSNIEPTQENAETSMLTSPMSKTQEPHYDSSPTSNDKNRMENTMFFPEPGGHIHTPTFSIASDMQVEVSEAGSPSMTVGNMSPNDRDSLSDDVEVELSNSTNFDCKSYDDVRQVMEDVEKLRNIVGSSETMAFENQDTTQLAARLSFEVLSEGTEKSWSLPDESVKEGSVIYDEGDSVTEIIEDIEDQEKEENEGEDEDGSQILTRRAIEESQQKPAEMRELEPTLHNEGSSENRDGHRAKDSAQPSLKGDLDLKVTEDSEKQTEQEGITDMSKSTETEDNLIEDRNLNRKDEVFSSNLNQEMDMDVPRSDLEELAKSSSPDEQLPDDTNLIMTQNGKHLMGVSSTHISNTSDFETLEEPSASEKFTDETNILSNTNEPVLVVIDKAANEESETLLSTNVSTEFSKIPAETNFEPNEGFKNGTG